MNWKTITPGWAHSRTGSRPPWAALVAWAALGAATIAECSSAGHGPAQAAAHGVDPPPSAAFPLRVEPGKRYLVDAAGRPFLVKGDAAWSLIAELTSEQAQRYLEDRRQRGFNAVLVNLIEHQYSSAPPNNAYGAPPFHEAGDYSTPNAEYFAHAERVVELARQNHMLVLLTPSYLGYEANEAGWYKEMQRNGAARLRAYGRYVARRLQPYGNVVWVQGGDFNPPEKDLVRAIAEGIRDVDPSKLQTFHGARRTSALGYLGPDETWLSLNDIYSTPASIVQDAFTEYARSSMPFFLIEAHYENEHGADERVVRQQAYQAILSGASGHVLGNRPVWGFFNGWEAALDSAGARSMTHLHALFDSMSWWTLQPDVAHQLLLSGAGSGERAVAAASADGTLAVAYVPSARFLNIDLGRLSGPRIEARWYDPTSGRFSDAPDASRRARGTWTCTTPGRNASGFEDWVLVLRSVP